MEALTPVRPAYGAGSIAELIPGVLAALGVPEQADPLDLTARLAGARRVAVLLVDGFGHQLLPLAAPVSPIITDVLAGRLGELRPLTAGFPSTTPTSLVTVGTGAPPGAHGVLGFTLAVPGTTRVLNHINWWADPDPAHWQPVPTRFGAAVAAGVGVSVVSRGEYAGSGLTTSAYRGAAYQPAAGVDELATAMLAELAGPAPRLVYGYHPDLDRIGHQHGVGSPQWRTAAGEVDRLLHRLLAGLPPDGALVVTADHGQLDVLPQDRFDLDADRRLRAGITVVAGEPRVRHLHTHPGAAPDVIAAWQAVLGDAAWVASREETVDEGWFGPVTAAHLPRIGDVVAICRDRHAVMASATDPPTVTSLVAFHGSWTAVEMLVPLLTVSNAKVGGAG